MNFFKPLLTDPSLELVQDITPNTAEGKLVQYSALWSEDRTFIVQIGMYPSTVLRATQKNELSYIFSLLRTGVGYSLYAVNPDTKKVVGSTVISDVDKNIAEVGFHSKYLESGRTFHARIDNTLSYCMTKQIGDNFIIWTTPMAGILNSVCTNVLFLIAGLILISVILVHAVSNTMDKLVINPIKEINKNLRSIQDGDLQTVVSVEDSREFLELSTHINSMVASLLQSSEKLGMIEKIQQQKNELERQHELLEEAIERTEAANNAKSEFLFNMSHDLRTPMNAIIGFTNLALENHDPDMQQTYLRNIDISSRQLLDLIDNILELSRIENHNLQIEESLVNINGICDNLYTIFGSTLKEKHLTYTVNLDIAHPLMYIDAAHYSQILLNLVSNAVKYTPEGGSISVSLKEQKGTAPGRCLMETVIEDTGIGMSAEFLEHAFESFSREHSSTVSGIQGSGLGLAIVENLVNLMDGTICIESTQGKGTKITIRTPHKLGETPSENPPQETDTLDYTMFEGIYILLAEDIDINAMIVTKLLTGKGCVVERAKDGVECVNMLKKSKKDYYDLILMDIQMPNMDGYEATKTIRAFKDKKKASIPILAITANAFKEDREKAEKSGMNGYISKPLDTVKMFHTIAEFL